jgi:pimeloyl-ACP methyl ester carboxylesterase
VIGDYAEALLTVVDALKLNSFDLYGSHTGASIAAEFSLRYPGRVRRLILDGIGLYSEAERASRLEHYAPQFVPDHEGAYLLRAFHFCREQGLFFPWYDKSRSARRDRGLPSAAALHDLLVEVLKAPTTYPLSYRAAFTYRAEEKVIDLRIPTLIATAEDDPLLSASQALARLAPTARFAAMPRTDAEEFRFERLNVISTFLLEDDSS